MNNSIKLNNNEELGDEIDIKALFKRILNGKRLIIASTVLFSIIAVIYSLTLSNIYQSTALLSPVGEQSSSNQSLNNIGGLASLAGINISSASGLNSTKAITKITTLSFFEENILPNIFLPDLMAVSTWDEENNSVIYKDSLYNVQTGKWNEIPHPQKSYEAFLKKLQVLPTQMKLCQK